MGEAGYTKAPEETHFEKIFCGRKRQLHGMILGFPRNRKAWRRVSVGSHSLMASGTVSTRHCQVDKITLDGVSIAKDSSVFQRGKGTIVDSGTTDTYLPKTVAQGFSNAWEKTTGSVSRWLLNTADVPGLLAWRASLADDNCRACFLRFPRGST